MFPLLKKTTRSDILSYVIGNTYYLSESGNDDTGDGSSFYPWRTLAKVQTVLDDGDCVVLRNGNYGIFDFEIERNYWVTYIAEEGHSPIIENISLRHDWNGSLYNEWLCFYGIKIVPAIIDPASSGNVGSDDPQYQLSDHNTYAKTDRCIDLKSMQYVEFYNCEIYNQQSKYLTPDAFYCSYSRNIRLEGCHAHDVQSGFKASDSSYVYFYYNNVHSICRSHFVGSIGSENIVIEGNHGWNRNWNETEDYCPRDCAPFHGSFIGISGPNFIVRNNLMHDGGGSSGIMLYDVSRVIGEPFAYHNVLIENNIIYDCHSLITLRIYDLGKNVIIRNNIIVGKTRDVLAVPQKYNTAFSLHTLGEGYDASGLYMHNNIFIGDCMMHGLYDQITEHDNIFWAINNDFDYYNQEELTSNSQVVVWNNSPEDIDFFQENFFNGEMDFTWQNLDEDIYPNSPGHGKMLDFTYDPAKGEFATVGALDENNFLKLFQVEDNYMKLLTIKNKKEYNEINEIIGVFKDDHIFSEHEKEIFNIIPIKSKEFFGKDEIEIALAIEDIETGEFEIINDYKNEDAIQIWKLKNESAWKKLSNMPKYLYAYEKGIKNNLVKHPENLNEIVIKEEIRARI